MKSIKLSLMSMIILMGAVLSVSAKTLPMPPKPNPVGEKQPVFGEANGNFTFDGKPAVIISGSIHYPRVPRAYWRDRIRKAKAMGFKKNYMKTALAHVETRTEMQDENTAIVRIKGERSRYLNPVFGAIATIFFLTDSYEVDKTLEVVKEDGQWKVCGTPFMLAEL